MKECFKNGLSLFGRLLVVGIMCFFVCISIDVLCTAAFTEKAGYEAYGYKDGDKEKQKLYTYYYKDGDDTKKVQYEKEGYTVETTTFRSAMSKKGNRVFLISSQIICTVILAAFVYPSIWQLGTKDSNLVRFKHKREDIFKGLKIGFIGSVPAFILTAALIVCSLGTFKSLPIALYRFLNCYNFSFIEWIAAGKVTAGELNILQYVLLVIIQLIVPAVAFGAYLLGYKDISLSEKLIYKKNKKQS